MEHVRTIRTTRTTKSYKIATLEYLGVLSSTYAHSYLVRATPTLVYMNSQKVPCIARSTMHMHTVVVILVVGTQRSTMHITRVILLGVYGYSVVCIRAYIIYIVLLAKVLRLVLCILQSSYYASYERILLARVLILVIEYVIIIVYVYIYIMHTSTMHRVLLHTRTRRLVLQYYNEYAYSYSWYVWIPKASSDLRIQLLFVL